MQPQPSSQSGSILIAAIVLLTLASVVAAGVATLVSQTAVGTASRLDNERALFAVETGRLAVQQEITECGPAPDGVEGDLENGGYRCVEDACERSGLEGRDVIIGWWGANTPEAASAVHQICFSAEPGFTRDDFRDCPSDVNCRIVDDGRAEGNQELTYDDESVAFGGGEDDGYRFSGNVGATFLSSDAVFLGPTIIRGNVTFSAVDSGPQEFGVVFTDDVTFGGNAEVTFSDTRVCFESNVLVDGNASVTVDGGIVRYVDGDPGLINHVGGAEISEGGDCGGGGTSWDYAS